MRMSFQIVCGLMLVFLVSGIAKGQGRLGDVRDAVRDEPEPPPTRKNQPDPFCDESEEPSFLQAIIEGALSGGSKRQKDAVKYITERDPNEISEPKYPSYPYPYGFAGYIQDADTDISWVTGIRGDTLDAKNWSLRLSLENGNDFSGLNRANGQLYLDNRYFGVHTSWNYFHENLIANQTDDLVMGTVNLYLQLPGPYLLLRTGLGGRILTDRCCTDGGVNAFLGIDVFPAQHWIFSGKIEGGNLGEASVFHGRFTVGYIYRRFEIFGGYDYLSLGNNDHWVDLEGPLVGVRVWF